MFSDSGVLRSRIWSRGNSWSFGLAEDGEKLLWFIVYDRKGKETHLKCYDPEKKVFVQDIPLKQQVVHRGRQSKCRYLTFSMGQLYISDLGLDKVYILDPNNLESFKRFGASGAGDGQFNEPAGIAVDDVGNILVADYRNHRLSLHDKKGKWIKIIKDRQVIKFNNPFLFGYLFSILFYIE